MNEVNILTVVVSLVVGLLLGWKLSYTLFFGFPEITGLDDLSDVELVDCICIKNEQDLGKDCILCGGRKKIEVVESGLVGKTITGCDKCGGSGFLVNDKEECSASETIG